MTQVPDMRRMSWALEPMPVLREGAVTEGPVELWLVVADAQRRPLALGPVSMSDLVPHAQDGLLTFKAVTGLTVVQAGLPFIAMVVMVNQADKTYAPVFPLFLSDPEPLERTDEPITNTWQWVIHDPTRGE